MARLIDTDLPNYYIPHALFSTTNYEIYIFDIYLISLKHRNTSLKIFFLRTILLLLLLGESQGELTKLLIVDLLCEM